MTDISHFARPGTQIHVRVTPCAGRNAVVADEGKLRVYVISAPEGGKANSAVAKLLSKAIGVPKSRLRLVRGDTSRDKVFRIEE
ncbi:hypothetical protein DEA8626_02178 [Defluviimonas aquaemixtae]|uniref:UPF0235 protein DEA8626_02178 n=1 Tax=Albidovulum aquaemixtae TaxID=1542388 RepID=A0A2R8B7R9_9RHOB|nr:DUF167 domain-containing protein [Defluviimonas aquaemixtae]SPH18638.1 hypothetical protein DEA8626_02178 [Defluviimonas aquaemixtae]